MKDNKPTKSTRTLFMLMAEFNGAPAIELEQCMHHLGYKTIGEANRAARESQLPFPTFRLRDSQRSPHMVHLDDLAKYIDEEHEKAARSWRAINGIAEPKEAETQVGNRRKRAA